MKFDRKICQKLEVIEDLMNGRVYGMRTFFEIDDFEGFAREYRDYQQYRKIWESLAKCGYVNLEVEEMARHVSIYFQV